MEPWSVEHRVFTYDTFIKTGESVTATQRLFRRHFNIGRHGNVPSRNTILTWIKNFKSTGAVLKKKPPGPQRTVRTPENVKRARAALINSPERSARRHATSLRINRESVRTILKKDLNFHPYKILFVQQLNDADYAQREDFAARMQVILEEKCDALIFMSDEAHFHLNGVVNKQNCRYWAEENPRQLHQRPLHSARVTVWCAISRCCVIGPFFFEENGTVVTVNSLRYVNMVNEYFVPQLRRMNIEQE